MPIHYIIYAPSNFGDVFAREDARSLRDKAFEEKLNPRVLVSYPAFNHWYEESNLSFEDVFKYLHKEDDGEILEIWIAGKGISQYVRDAMTYAFRNGVDIECLSPQDSLLEKYARPFIRLQKLGKTNQFPSISTNFLIT